MVIVYKVKEVKKVKSRKILKNDERKRSIFMNNSTWRVSSDCDGHFEEKKKTIEIERKQY